ncbi:MAG: ABC transporter ATP-binding protein [Crenarchaeota archaeon]|nr:ABC transporter ATP-binding protein [Thermoproteota archaeon]MCR8455286.1 ABC transporter ATP-binding protein [Thermoproteota archaeon]MCR8487211.1 ABC transporter ATP-binding protein [Thermoproteota archaeon]MCR8500803.1 ABC transporter ATP-binding protein [Thermoproteota archaeon]
MSELIFKVENLVKWFPVRRTIFDVLRRREKLYVRAVDGISFDIRRREIFALVGESGSGKTTTGRLLIRLETPTSGRIIYKNTWNLAAMTEAELKPFRRELQVVWQDPYGALNPKMTLKEILEEPLIFLTDLDADERLEKVIKALQEVNLVPVEEFLHKHPIEISGGQRQRVVVAKALIVDPDFIVADEPVSMVDVSMRASILGILERARRRRNTTILYITHDLATAGYVADRIAVMYLGKIFEMGPTRRVLLEPLNPYSKALISATPVPDPTVKRERIILKGEIPSPIFIPSGCRFWPRCPWAMDVCRRKEPPMTQVERDRWVYCWLFAEEKAA